MPGIICAHHTSFTVADLSRSLDFFCRHFALEVLSTREISDAYFGRIVGFPGCQVKGALLRIPGTDHHLELFEYLHPVGRSFAPRPCDPGSAPLSLLVDDLPALYDRLRGEGVAFVSEPVRIDAGRNAGGYGVYLHDPNGILIELFQAPRQASS